MCILESLFSFSMCSLVCLSSFRCCPQVCEPRCGYCGFKISSSHLVFTLDSRLEHQFAVCSELVSSFTECYQLIHQRLQSVVVLLLGTHNDSVELCIILQHQQMSSNSLNLWVWCLGFLVGRVAHIAICDCPIPLVTNVILFNISLCIGVERHSDHEAI